MSRHLFFGNFLFLKRIYYFRVENCKNEQVFKFRYNRGIRKGLKRNTRSTLSPLLIYILLIFVFFFLIYRLPVVSDCPAGQTARVTSNHHSSSSTMAVSRVPSPPLPEVNTPVAENWCYTQVSVCFYS